MVGVVGSGVVEFLRVVSSGVVGSGVDRVGAVALGVVDLGLVLDLGTSVIHCSVAILDSAMSLGIQD